MITGSEPPRWLAAYLEWWSQGIRHDIMVDEYRPSKLQTAERLLGVEQAVAILRREFEEPSIRNLLVTAKTTKRIGISIADLKDLSERAALVRKSNLRDLPRQEALQLSWKVLVVRLAFLSPDVTSAVTTPQECECYIWAWQFTSSVDWNYAPVRAAWSGHEGFASGLGFSSLRGEHRR